jgi:hypothetical protein
MAAVKSARRTNPIILREEMTIGRNSAESDEEFLFDCFVHHSAVDSCSDVQNPGMALVGRTGKDRYYQVYCEKLRQYS